MAIQINIADLDKELKARLKATEKLVVNAAKHSARRALPRLRKDTPVDTGNARSSWEIINGPIPFKFSIHNDCPYIGVLERGARPHKMGRSGIDAIMGWVARKFGVVDPIKQKAIAFAIAAKIEKEGSKGNFMARNLLPEISKMCKDKFELDLEKILDRRLSK